MEFSASPSLFAALLADLAWVVRAVQGVLGTLHLAGRLETGPAHRAHRRFQLGFQRVERLLARYLAGRRVRFAERIRAEAPVVRAAAAAAPAVAAPTVGGARRFGWLVALGGYQAAGCGAQLGALLARPEMVGLLEASPAAGRALRSMCWALGIEAATLQPGIEAAALQPGVAVEAPVAAEKNRKVRAKRAPVDFGRIALPRGVLAAAKRQGFGKRV